MSKFCNTNKNFGKEVINIVQNMGYLKNDRNTIFWQLLSKMIFKKEALISFCYLSNAIINNCWFSWLVLLLFWWLAILLFSIILLAKSSWALVIAISSLFQSLRSNYEKLKFDEVQVIWIRCKFGLWIQKL